MGWWSATVLGGDTPLDMLGGIEDLLGLGDDVRLYPPENLSRAQRAQVAARVNDWLAGETIPAAVERLSSGSVAEDQIAAQVLATVVMSVGAHMPDELRNAAVAAADNDSWAGEGHQGRVREMARFAALVRDYDETVILTPTEGLFAALANR